MNHKTTHKIANYLFGGAIIIALIVVGLLVWPYKIISMEQPHKGLTPVVKAGEDVRYEVTFCKHSDIIGDIDIQLVDDVIYNIVPSKASNLMGCKDTVGYKTIPKSIPDGTYYLRFTITYKVNPLRTITETYETEKFQVIS